jgi:hypothetical protein
MPKQQDDIEPLARCRPDAHEVFAECHFTS